MHNDKEHRVSCDYIQVMLGLYSGIYWGYIRKRKLKVRIFVIGGLCLANHNATLDCKDTKLGQIVKTLRSQAHPNISFGTSATHVSGGHHRDCNLRHGHSSLPALFEICFILMLSLIHMKLPRTFLSACFHCTGITALARSLKLPVQEYSHPKALS